MTLLSPKGPLSTGSPRGATKHRNRGAHRLACSPHFRPGKTPRQRSAALHFWRGDLLRRRSIRHPHGDSGAVGAPPTDRLRGPHSAALLRLPARLRFSRPETPCGPRLNTHRRAHADFREMRAALSFSQPTTPGKVVRCAPPPRPPAHGRGRPLPGRAERQGDRAGGDPRQGAGTRPSATSTTS